MVINRFQRIGSFFSFSPTKDLIVYSNNLIPKKLSLFFCSSVPLFLCLQNPLFRPEKIRTHGVGGEAAENSDSSFNIINHIGNFAGRQGGAAELNRL